MQQAAKQVSVGNRKWHNTPTIGAAAFTPAPPHHQCQGPRGIMLLAAIYRLHPHTS